jgi:hypothetical protein
LGAIRKDGKDLFPRNPEGRVVFLQSWWRAGLGYAAQALCRFQNDVKKIQTAPEVVGEVSIYKRWYTKEDSWDHECFDTGSVIQVRFCLPRRLQVADFHELLDVAGEYVGISPYGYKQDFGRFEVLEVRPYKRHRKRREKCLDHAGGKPDSFGSALQSDAGPTPTLHEETSDRR